MSNKPSADITSSTFLSLALTHASATAENAFRATPHYDQLQQSQVAWEKVLKTLGKSTIEHYENIVNGAFDEYQALLEDYFWTLGLISTIKKHLPAKGDLEQQQNTPSALIAVEGKLKQTCIQFSELLNAEVKEKCDRYLQLRKSAVDIAAACCCRHGMNFVNELLLRVGLNSEQNGE